MKRAKTNGFTRTGNRRAMALFMAALAMGTLLTGCGERAEGTSESGGQSDASSSEEQPSARHKRASPPMARRSGKCSS